ncbi:MAG: hypothetical protein G01um101420_234 [Parcubacteria group bacterium Gr01-1014_20]|nr:MAG: hypothetical protein G01um101420_234 [Parcubacteria group bacterium Gr01-1014_20]
MRPSFKLPFSLLTGFLLSFVIYQFLFEKKCTSGPALFPIHCTFLEITLMPSLTVVIAIIIYLLIPKNDD